MVNDYILNGLRVAIAKGETLKEAMISFYNAGYTRQEIEESARVLQMEQTKEMQLSVPPSEKTQSGQESSIIPVNKELPSPLVQNVQTASPQKVSDYEKKPPKKKTLLLIILILLMTFLLGLLAMIFFFKENILNFLKNL